MERDKEWAEKVNKELLDNFRKWLNEDAVKNWFNEKIKTPKDENDEVYNYLIKKGINYEIAENYSLSEPFFMGVSSYDKDKPLIMVVGQETNDYGRIDNIWDKDKNCIKEEELENRQDYTIACMEALNSGKDEFDWNNEKHKVPNHNFFKLMKELTKYYNVCWNNLDKIVYAYSDDNKIEKLYRKDEKILNGKLNGKYRLMEKEINIVNPNVVLFAVGPDYIGTLEDQIKSEIFNGNKPSKENCVIASEKDGIKYYYSYHPQYYKNKIIDKILNFENK